MKIRIRKRRILEIILHYWW